MEKRIDEFLDTIPAFVPQGWDGSRFIAWQKQSNGAKGTRAERFVKEYLEDKGYENDHKGGGNLSFDLQFNKCKIEVKVAFAGSSDGTITADKFTWNHIGMHKDWDCVVFIGINPPTGEGHIRQRNGWREDPEEFIMFWVNREQISKFIDQGYFSIQQGGGESGNDDWMPMASFLQAVNYGHDYQEVPF